MPSVPKKTRERREKPQRAKKGVLDTARRVPSTEQVRKIILDLRKVAKAGARNKLAGATSDHSFLYGDGGVPI